MVKFLYKIMGFIQMYDLATKNTIAITSDIAWSGNQQMGDDTVWPAIYGDKVVYVKLGDDKFGNAGVYVYNISTEQNAPVCVYTNGTPKTPDIYNDTIVWGMDSNYDGRLMITASI